MWARPARSAVRALDTLLRRAHGVCEFSAEHDCILRVGIGHSERDVHLADGTAIARGERIGELHLWNERLPRMGARGADMHWAVAMRRGLSHSLRLLAEHVQDDPTWNDVRAFRGETAMEPRWIDPSGRDVLGRLGLELQPRRAGSCLRRFGDFWENFYTWWLIWTFAPGSLRNKRFRQIQRCQVWVSRPRLLAEYGGRASVRRQQPIASDVYQGVYR